jgi:hypothetical protein
MVAIGYVWLGSAYNTVADMDVDQNRKGLMRSMTTT